MNPATAPPPQLSASVTRILALSNFPIELKTRDIISAFSQWENDRGGFKVKWVDDTHALVVFADAGVAKSAYLSSLLHPHLSLSVSAIIRPYDGPDAQAIIASVNARTGAPAGGAPAGAGHTNGRRTGSVSGMGSFVPPPPAGGHQRGPSLSSHHRMGSIGSAGGSSWAPPAGSSSTGGPSSSSAPTSSTGGRRESLGTVGSADAALTEIRRALRAGAPAA